MKKLNPNGVGLAVGGTVAFLHLVWSFLVMMGLAVWLMDFVFMLHFLNNPFELQPFAFGPAVTLIIVTFGVGYAVGWVFTSMWNMVAKNRS